MTPPSPPTPERLRRYHAHGHTVLELTGEIDIAALLQLMPHVDAATETPEQFVVIDLTLVTFLDCSGLRLLCHAHRRVTTRQGNLELVCPHPLIRRVLHITRLDSVFDPVHTLAEALGRHTPHHGTPIVHG
ncbi:STAS domain-containing protein [Streptomyces flavofungini]|uniref:STAS domain-containing protein n=1 Tax=Streptomyces flavofungini TaxID=68200 RepID=UPI0025AF63CF|nr:STAS domain-containing protein [Streptomyces flavofungini]WJV48974.1 STAS domain-containing protein [Streptomyces flavofungini]